MVQPKEPLTDCLATYFRAYVLIHLFCVDALHRPCVFTSMVNLDVAFSILGRPYVSLCVVNLNVTFDFVFWCNASSLCFTRPVSMVNCLRFLVLVHWVIVHSILYIGPHH